MVVFFFSSRRRHTRWPRDWSSDVCSSDLSVGASAMWSGLRHMDGVDLLYAGSRNIDQHGSAMDVRLGALKAWPGDRALETTQLYNHYRMTHDVTWADSFWDPNLRVI